MDFVSDEFRTLPDAEDRLFSTIVTADWTYGSLPSFLDYDQVSHGTSRSHHIMRPDQAWSTAHGCILEVFAGPADQGVFSPSVQNSQHLTQKLILQKLPQVVHYWLSLCSSLIRRQLVCPVYCFQVLIQGNFLSL